MVLEELQTHSKRMDEFKTMFVQATSENDRTLTLPDFAEFCQNEKVQAYFRRMGLHVDNENAAAFFGFMDVDRDGRVELDEFICGCSSFIGSARQLDIAKLQVESVTIKSALRELVRLLQQEVFPGIGGASVAPPMPHSAPSLRSAGDAAVGEKQAVW